MAREQFLEIDKKDEKNLTKRYLFWLYKVTKEGIERIDRKFTQLDIDNDMLEALAKAIKKYPRNRTGEFDKPLSDFKNYIYKKDQDAKSMKFNIVPFGELKADYIFLKLKLQSIEALISMKFGQKALTEAQGLYEDFSIKRIFTEPTHR